jgi:hypothetical protein
MVPAGGIGISRPVENTELIDFPTRQKRMILQNCVQLERIWNATFFVQSSRFLIHSELDLNLRHRHVRAWAGPLHRRMQRFIRFIHYQVS